MIQKELLKYNKRCIEFLGYLNTTITDKDFNIYVNEKGITINNKIYKSIELMSAKFNSDWNWIMVIKEKICQLNIVDEFNTQYDSVAKGFICSILPSYRDTFDSIYTKVCETEKQAVVGAINQFLIWYNENKN